MITFSIYTTVKNEAKKLNLLKISKIRITVTTWLKVLSQKAKILTAL